MNLNTLIDHLTKIRDAYEPNGYAEVLMVDRDGKTLPVESPVMVGRDLCLYSEKLF